MYKWTTLSIFATAGKSGADGLAFPLEVPNSCIESAEYIMQCISNGKTHNWTPQEVRDPHVIVTFGGTNNTIDVTDDHILRHNVGKTDYEFSGLPSVGQGVMCLWSKQGNAPRGHYNMHLGAVVATGVDDKGAGVACISDLSEQIGGATKLTAMAYLIVKSPEDFRGSGYPPGDYAIGALTVKTS